MLQSRTERRVAAFFVAWSLLVALAVSVGGCNRGSNQVPELQGNQKPIDSRNKVTGFGLVSAGRGEQEGETAIEL